PLRTVNVYALIGKDGWALVDAGIGVPEARAAFWEGLQRIGGAKKLKGAPQAPLLALTVETLRTIVLSHDHPDHIGLSGELHERSGATIYMHPIDANNMRFLWQDIKPERFTKVSHFFRQHGMPIGEPWLSQASPEQLHNIIKVPPFEEITLAEDGQYLHLSGE